MYTFAGMLAHGPSGLYHLTGNWRSQRIDRLCRLRHAALLRIDGRHVLRKRGFLAAAAAGMRFPGWCGADWDGYADCLTDLSWAPAHRYVIVLGGMERFAAHSPRDLRTALEILEEAAAWWGEHGVAFRVLIASAGAQAALPTVRTP